MSNNKNTTSLSHSSKNELTKDKYTPKEVAFILSFSYNTVLNKIKRGGIEAIQQKGCFFVSKEEMKRQLSLLSISDKKVRLAVNFTGKVSNQSLDDITIEIISIFSLLNSRYNISLSYSINNQKEY